MKIKIFVSALLAVALTGCANSNGQLDMMSNKIDNLSSKVQYLTDEVNALKEQQMKNNKAIKQAAMDAKEANERVDNMVKSYKK